MDIHRWITIHATDEQARKQIEQSASKITIVAQATLIMLTCM